ncbi:cryptococcal mannosyltransferase 1-domain-containing protein [Aspergillus carlsbadensis]|nr:cryptococcal mannosyltransferase 1-domain-containing protein [Aspergillus carlsbadensis]
MTSRLLHPDEYELDLRSRSSIDSQGTFNLDEADFESQTIPKHSSLIYRPPLISRILGSNYYYSGYRRLRVSPSKPFLAPSKRPSCYYRRCVPRRISFFLQTLFGIILALLVLASTFRPSYTWRPAHYTALSQTVANSTTHGRGNPRNEKIFIAASLYDRGGDIAGGQWGQRILTLIDLLGEENVFLSIYENDSGSAGAGALLDFKAQVSCNKSIVIEDKLDWADLHAVTVPGGSKRVKRIEYLAEVRNRALRPLDTDDPEKMRFDKLLYLNDIIFDPVDALQLLFSTHADENGLAQYRAACAVDFINPFKFYDTYATRDLQGYGVGLPFFPWFTTAGNGSSRKDVLAGTDAVRVRSCWGGMVAFDARYFQQPKAGPSQDHAARFRASHDPFWEASECCLVHADIQDIPVNPEDIEDTGIYMNPYVRVAYDPRSFSWLGFTRRFERLYTLIHNIGSHLASLPHYNPRRTEVPGQRVFETAWVPNDDDYRGGSYQDIRRIAANDGFCGRRGLQVLVQDPAQVRRVIIKGLPASWSTPDKVLSLIHGGVIESVSIAPSGNAHVLFCDPAACKAFYDKYPNGVDLDKERKLTVFVDLGEEVDVISSQLSFNLSLGSTRIVRAVGVDMETTMNELVKIATSNHRKVEKIVDSYVPDYPRAVNFRFCSIEDAVRFRAALIRNEDWEHCNVQYATDP